MKKFLFVLIILSLMAGCSAAPPEPAETETTPEPTGTTAASETPRPTAETTGTAAPTQTQPSTATATALPTPTVTPQVISAATVRELTFTRRLGGGAMQAVVLSPDASHVAVLTSLSLMLYEVESGSLQWERLTGKVFEELRFSDTGRILTARTRGGSVQHWDAASGEPGGDTLPVVPNARHVSLSHSGGVLVAVDNFDQTYLWDTTSGELLQSNNGLAFPFGVIEAAVSPDGLTFINSGIDSKNGFQIRVWDVPRGRFFNGLRGLPGEVRDLQYSPDSQFAAALGTRVAGGLHGIQNLYLWRVEDGALLDTVDLALDASAYTFLGDNATVLVGTTDGMVMFVEFRFGERYTYGYIKDQVFSHDAEVIGISSSADGQYYATAAADGSVKVWRIADGEQVFSTSVVGLSLTTLTEEWVYADLSIFVRSHDAHTALNPGGTLYAQTAPDLRSVNLLDAASGEIIKNLKIELNGYYSLPVFSPDGKTVAAAFNDRQIIFWDVESGWDILRLTTAHTRQIKELQYSPDGSQISSQSEGQLFVWDPAEAALLHTLTAFRTFAYSPDGSRIVTDGRETGIFLLDALTGKKLLQIDSYFVNDMVVTPDNLLIAVAGYRIPVRYQQDNLVYFLDVENQKFLRTIELPGYPAPVMDIAYTPDGSALVTIDEYGNMYVWDARAGTLLQRFDEVVLHPADIHFAQDGRTMMITNGDNTIQYYEIGENTIE